MNKCNFIENNSLETIDKKNLSKQTKFRLDEISKIKNYSIEEINHLAKEYHLFHLKVLLEHQLE